MMFSENPRMTCTYCKLDDRLDDSVSGISDRITAHSISLGRHVSGDRSDQYAGKQFIYCYNRETHERDGSLAFFPRVEPVVQANGVDDHPPSHGVHENQLRGSQPHWV